MSSGTRARLAAAAALAALAPAGAWSADYYGTLEPFASEAVYFVLTDRFVNGDPANDHRDQGGANRTFDRPLETKSGVPDNIGYLGGDFAGILANAEYIRDMGFTAVWITPIVDNPDEAFTGGFGIGDALFADRGKTGYHGYWGVNFYRVDEHLESEGLAFADFARRMRDDHGLRIVLDVVANHGSPSFTMPVDQPKFGEIYDREGRLVADHQNLPPERLDPANPLHRFFHRERDLAELSNFDDTNPAVMDYLVGAYLQWIEEGASAFRIDTIRHVPGAFWREFTTRIRARHPGFFMFGEHFEYDAAKIAVHMLPENGGVSVLDFPGQAAMAEVFGKADGDYGRMREALHLADGVYRNPYELMSFYDNHDMARLDATEDGFIDANNWLFTARGIPVVYYGSEIAFMAGTKEHEGNRNYFGPTNIERARRHRIREALARIARIRHESPALQRGLQVNLELERDRASFLRVFARGDEAETALVLLNKGDAPARFTIDRAAGAAAWRDAMGGTTVAAAQGEPLRVDVPAHGVRVLLRNGGVEDEALREKLERAMRALARTGG